jgi:hypothetical protein
MNERFKQLAVESKLGSAEFGNGVQYYVATQETFEKFAELIVRECCLALNPMLRDMISRGQGVDMIKLHFGMNPKEITTAMLDASIAQCEQELAKKKSGVEE